MTVFLIATLDTKGLEAQFVRDFLKTAGVKVTLVDTGCLGQPQVSADITREAVFAAAGTSLEAVKAQSDRGFAVTTAARGVTAIVQKVHQTGDLQGVFSLGGSAGTTIGTAAMRCLPMGIPKLMVSTLASGDVRAFVGVRDILMMNSIVDIAGLNHISRTVLREAAAAMVGMVNASSLVPSNDDRPIIAATMFGVTTPCVEQARQVLETAGYEVLVFHATGTGGQAMEELINDGMIAGVLDITTTEIADEVVGGMLSAGPLRLTAAGARGIPQVVSVGATDMVNFWAMSSVPVRFQNRQLYQHNENVTLMRTTPAECRQIGEQIANKLNAAVGPVRILLPLQGVSAIDREGEPFDDRTARSELFNAIRLGIDGPTIVELDQHINDERFAVTAAETLIELMTK
ncbi:MAG: Tm-1-like ATP-binding domain-containing protein [Pirellulaceae bacterium]|nr:Tm-1-like ATP-binding domain-containing protein [Pirellulaceae bacterium]